MNKLAILNNSGKIIGVCDKEYEWAFISPGYTAVSLCDDQINSTIGIFGELRFNGDKIIETKLVDGFIPRDRMFKKPITVLMNIYNHKHFRKNGEFIDPRYYKIIEGEDDNFKFDISSMRKFIIKNASEGLINDIIDFGDIDMIKYMGHCGAKLSQLQIYSLTEKYGSEFVLTAFDDVEPGVLAYAIHDSDIDVINYLKSHISDINIPVEGDMKTLFIILSDDKNATDKIIMWEIDNQNNGFIKFVVKDYPEKLRIGHLRHIISRGNYKMFKSVYECMDEDEPEWTRNILTNLCIDNNSHDIFTYLHLKNYPYNPYLAYLRCYAKFYNEGVGLSILEYIHEKWAVKKLKGIKFDGSIVDISLNSTGIPLVGRINRKVDGYPKNLSPCGVYSEFSYDKMCNSNDCYFSYLNPLAHGWFGEYTAPSNLRNNNGIINASNFNYAIYVERYMAKHGTCC